MQRAQVKALGLRAAGHQWGAAVAVVQPRSWPTKRSPPASSRPSPASTVRRWLRRRRAQTLAVPVLDRPAGAGLRRQRAAVVLDLYAGSSTASRSAHDDYVICSDEKTSIQARCRCHPTLPPGRARLMRVEHEYDRGGALAYLAAWDVHRGKVFGRCEPTTGIAPFARLVEQVMTQEPYACARRVFWVVDNGSSHRGQESINRMAKAWPTATLVHTPVHACWLNQCEIYFSVVQRKVVTPNDFYDLADVAAPAGSLPRPLQLRRPAVQMEATPPKTSTICSTASPPTTPGRTQPPA